MSEIVERFCVVCGMGSHRTDWANRTPACDNHSKAEVDAALASKTKSKGSTPAPDAKSTT